MPDGEPTADDSLVRRPKPRDKRKIIIIAVVVSAVVLLIVIIAVLAWRFRKIPKPYLIHHPNVYTISFNPMNKSSYRDYVNQISTKIEAYLPAHQENIGYVVNCTSPQPRSENLQTQCYFDVTTVFGSDCTHENHYGFKDGAPCILLELRTPKEWIPKNYNRNKTLPKDVYIVPDHVGINCTEPHKEDEGAVGEIKYYPRSGFPFKYFPSNFTREYLPPLVMVQVPIHIHDLVIGIQCKAFAPNADTKYFQSYFQIYIL